VGGGVFLGVFGRGTSPDAPVPLSASVAVVEPVVMPSASPVVVLPAPEVLPAGRPIDLEVKEAAAGDVMRMLGTACGMNVVVPSSVEFSATVKLKDVPCDQALEVLLESRELWYRYAKDGNILRVGPRKFLDSEELQARERARFRAETGMKDEPLPEGKRIDLELQKADIRGVVDVLAAAGGVNVVMDDSIRGTVTVFARDVAWHDALRAILQSEELWYRYRENGKVLRVAPRRLLDSEDLQQRERERLRKGE
jgi:type II secretory pathway component HofQ